MISFEVNYDGLVGPTHNYAGLSYGNVASTTNKKQVSNPREAALQGLTKMKALSDLGLAQAVLPPQSRPDVAVLRRLGFRGESEEVILAHALREAPEILASVSSASSMWTANAATVSPSSDCEDERVHFTAANLSAKFHRAIEHETTTRVLKRLFPSDAHFAHHEALPSGSTLGDEGAANHTRFCDAYGDPGVEFFVYGRVALDNSGVEPKKFPARQTREASAAIARLHRLREGHLVYAQQNPLAIDAGAFHNDVVSVGNQNVLFYHEQAFLNSDRVIAELRERFAHICGTEFVPVKVPSHQVSLEDAVKSYLFNSQLVTLPKGHMALIAPRESEEQPRVKAFIDQLRGGGGPIREVLHFDLRQSMQNGGGPACLRLRVVLNERERAAANAAAFMSDTLHARLTAWVEKHYRDRLSLADLADPKLSVESRTALDELTQILNLGSVYPFQL